MFVGKGNGFWYDGIIEKECGGIIVLEMSGNKNDGKIW